MGLTPTETITYSRVDGHRGAASALIGLSQLHALDLHGADMSALIAKILHRVGERKKFDPLLLCVLDLLHAGRHLGL